MVRISEELLRKRSEHNDGILRTLEEITLHQFDITRIELVGQFCPKLKILFFQNNLISKIENLYRLKSLQYLNLALNNIQIIEGLYRCESLKKLDLTVNFVDVHTLEKSISNLQQNEFLSELFLTGNPCQNFSNYRFFVIEHAPQIKSLDGVPITKTERIKAKQQRTTILEDLRKSAQERLLEIEKEKQAEEEAKKNGTWTGPDEEKHSPEARYATYLKEVEEEKNDELERKAQQKFGKPEDALKKARQKLGERAEEGEDGSLPKQRNQHRFEFKMEEDDGEGNVRILIKCPKFIDINLIEVDIHPLWFQAIIKSKSILLHLPAEVHSTESRVRRVLSTGWLELICPRLHPLPKKKKSNAKKFAKKPIVEEKEELQMDFIDDPDVPPLI